jgi:hypothetical protein
VFIFFTKISSYSAISHPEILSVYAFVQYFRQFSVNFPGNKTVKIESLMCIEDSFPGREVAGEWN